MITTTPASGQVFLFCLKVTISCEPSFTQNENLMSDKSDIENYISLLNDKVAKNVTIVSKEDLGQDFFLHISPDNMSKKKYVPWISERQADTEDRTVPRITVSDNLVGCLFGYSMFFSQVLNYIPSEDESFKQGLYIHEIQFDHCLKPTNKLVYDHTLSNEHWLVTYNQATKEYKGKVIGKMFVKQLVITPNDTKYGSEWVVDLFIEVTKDEGIKLSEKVSLKKGYHSVNFSCIKVSGFNKDKTITAKEITKEEFLSAKKVSAALLSYVEPTKPLIAQW